MRWLSTAARTCAPKRVYSSVSAKSNVIARPTPTRKSR